MSMPIENHKGLLKRHLLELIFTDGETEALPYYVRNFDDVITWLNYIMDLSIRPSNIQQVSLSVNHPHSEIVGDVELSIALQEDDAVNTYALHYKHWIVRDASGYVRIVEDKDFEKSAFKRRQDE